MFHDVPERTERDRLISGSRRPITHCEHQAAAKTSTSVRRVHVQLIEVRNSRLEDLDVREADWHIAGARHPQSAVATRGLEHVVTRRLQQN